MCQVPSAQRPGVQCPKNNKRIENNDLVQHFYPSSAGNYFLKCLTAIFPISEFTEGVLAELDREEVSPLIDQ